MSKFERLRKAGVKYNARMNRTLELRLVEKIRNQTYASLVWDTTSGKTIVEHVTQRWVQSFMQNKNVISRSQTEKVMISPAKKKSY